MKHLSDILGLDHNTRIQVKSLFGWEMLEARPTSLFTSSACSSGRLSPLTARTRRASGDRARSVLASDSRRSLCSPPEWPRNGCDANETGAMEVRRTEGRAPLVGQRQHAGNFKSKSIGIHKLF